MKARLICAFVFAYAGPAQAGHTASAWDHVVNPNSVKRAILHLLSQSPGSAADNLLSGEKTVKICQRKGELTRLLDENGNPAILDETYQIAMLARALLKRMEIAHQTISDFKGGSAKLDDLEREHMLFASESDEKVLRAAHAKIQAGHGRLQAVGARIGNIMTFNFDGHAETIVRVMLPRMPTISVNSGSTIRLSRRGVSSRHLSGSDAREFQAYVERTTKLAPEKRYMDLADELGKYFKLEDLRAYPASSAYGNLLEIVRGVQWILINSGVYREFYPIGSIDAEGYYAQWQKRTQELLIALVSGQSGCAAQVRELRQQLKGTIKLFMSHVNQSQHPVMRSKGRELIDHAMRMNGLLDAPIFSPDNFDRWIAESRALLFSGISSEKAVSEHSFALLNATSEILQNLADTWEAACRYFNSKTAIESYLEKWKGPVAGAIAVIEYPAAASSRQAIRFAAFSLLAPLAEHILVLFKDSDENSHLKAVEALEVQSVLEKLAEMDKPDLK